MKGVVFDIKSHAVHDGPGVRTTVFLKGCPLRCWWCHKPESQKLQPEAFPHMDKIDEFTFECDAMVGRQMSVEEVLEEIVTGRPFYEESGGGATFSGGEPLMQFQFLSALLDACREVGIHTCLNTSGFAPPNKFREILNKPGLFLYDIKLFSEASHFKYTGVSNLWIFSNLEMLFRHRKRVILRFPAIPGITASEQNLIQLKKFLYRHKASVEELELLPYQRIPAEKYLRFDKLNRMNGVPEPSLPQLEQLKSWLEETGAPVKIVGAGTQFPRH